MTATRFDPRRLPLPQAIESLCAPGIQWTLDDSSDIATLHWLDPAQAHPTNDAITAEAARIVTLPLLGAVPLIISDRQFFQQLAVQAVITQDEAIAAVATGTLPASMVSLVNSLPVDQQFAANMMLKGATNFERSHPMTALLGQMYGWTDAQLDALWTAAAAL